MDKQKHKRTNTTKPAQNNNTQSTQTIASANNSRRETRHNNKHNIKKMPFAPTCYAEMCQCNCVPLFGNPEHFKVVVCPNMLRRNASM